MAQIEQFRIAVVGSHGVGKTTLIQGFLNNHPYLAYEHITGIPRAIIKRGFPMGKSSTVDSFTNYVRDQLRAERRAMLSKVSFVISDRTILDASAYAFVNSKLPRPGVPNYFIEMIHEVWRREAQYYDLIIYIPVEFSMTKDGIRDDDDQYRLDVDKEIESLLKEDGINYFRINGTIAERISTLNRQLRISAPHLFYEKTRVATLSTVVDQNNNLFDYKNQMEVLEKAGYGDILHSQLLQKLEGVSFLGLLDNVYNVDKPSNRLEHTVGVAFLALELSRKLQLEEEDTDVLVIASLLHDAGHAPFSHNSEPFLLETRKLYHTGVLSKYLKPDFSMSSGLSLSDKDLLYRNQRILDKVINLLNGSSSTCLQNLFHSPLNCDKIEGNARTGHHLSLSGVSPMEVLKIFSIKDGAFFVNSSYLDTVDRFWDHERQLYWELIYTDHVFSAEAMLTRALHIKFDDYNINFLQMSDEEVRYELLEHELTKELIYRIEDRNYLTPLSKYLPELFETVKEEFKECRFDQPRRMQLEFEIANKLGLEKTLVISHFSRRKHFRGNTHGLRQLDLFDKADDQIPLSKIDDVLRRTKVSGDFFDVFLPL